MLAAKRTRKHGDLDCSGLVALLLRVLEVLVSLLRVRHTLLHIVETLVAWTHRVLVGLEFPIAVRLVLVLVPGF